MFKCPFCTKEFEKLISHTKHVTRIHKGEISMFDYYFTFVSTNESKKCRYCNLFRKPARYTRMYDTCGSKDCKTLFSRKGVNSQIEQEGKKEWLRKRRDKRNVLHPDLNHQIALKVNKTLAKNRKANKGFRSKEEKILFKYLSFFLNYTLVSANDTLFYTSRSWKLPEDGLNIIMDIAIPEFQLNIEVDGSYHDNRKETDKKRDVLMKNKGWKVLRISNALVNSNLEECLNLVREKLV